MEERNEFPLTITGRHFEISEPLRKYVEKKVCKLGKYLNNIIEAHVILTEEKYLHIAEITIKAEGSIFHGAYKSNDMSISIGKAIEKIGIQLRKHKEKLVSHSHTESMANNIMKIVSQKENNSMSEGEE